MSRMKHLLRKLHIGGGGALEPQHQHHHPHRLVEQRASLPPPPTALPLAASISPVSTSISSSLSSSPPSRVSAAGEAAVNGEENSGGGSRSEATSTAVCAGGGGGGDFSLLEEEYQVQLALAISASDPNGIDDLDSVQMKAAKQMSLESAAATAGVGSCSGGNSDDNMELLSLRYWNYNVVDYDEKLMDGFYDVYGIVSNPDRKLPSLVDLQAVSVSDRLEYEVVVVNSAVDHALQQLEERALSIAVGCRERENGAIDSGLVHKVAQLVADHMGGPVDDAEDMLRRWTIRSQELRTSLNTIVLPLGLLGVGLSRHRALLFKVLADLINLPCKLVKGSYYTGTDEGAINLIKVDYECEYIIDLMGAPGTLIPAEVPSSHLQNSGTILHCSDTIEQSVKDLCLALDKASCLSEKKNEVSEVDSSDRNCISGTGVSLELQENTEHLLHGGNIGVSDARYTERSENETEMLVLRADEEQRGSYGIAGVISPVEQMKVNDVSKYVVTAAKNPEFAQKLHAVLLESGASPPLDLFSNLNTVHEAVNQKVYGNNMCKEGKLGKEIELPHPLAVPTTETVSSSYVNSKNDHEKLVEVTGKPVQSSSLSAGPIIASNAFLETNPGVILESPPFQAPPPTDETDLSNNLSTSAKAAGIQHPHGKEGTSNHDQLLSGGSEKKGINLILDSVGEWEIRWEDLHIGERIGLGSYGEVYRADWNGTDVAVKKFLDQDLSGDALELFRCEVRIMLRLRHPNVVLFMGAVMRPPNLSILTEFLPRGSLYRLLHRPNVKLDEKRRLKMALDVAKGMNYLHTSHPTIVHRDLKSPNLLVDKNWVVKRFVTLACQD
ncbi:Serine/threonine-protein kinase EDR1 [Apostasia shenzhenica]|uniref:non-specific serine/threonine protein kinase n=1 Tax=Apostasia shenzhenica TaxID=1088818 RepID=A0A2I0B779_9ASPA|nr:Serine/threonine-protein kinase EDR1 [Apostasia shenzhenica]